jgi:quercetin dioxygenase-like cupin family protein
MINEITVEHNSSDVQHLQWVYGLTNYHTDLEDRTVTVISGEGWQFQYEGEDPIDMTEDLIIEIPANKSHKIIKGTTDLVVSIEVNS